MFNDDTYSEFTKVTTALLWLHCSFILAVTLSAMIMEVANNDENKNIISFNLYLCTCVLFCVLLGCALTALIRLLQTDTVIVTHYSQHALVHEFFYVW